ncbi:MAG: DUF262 domain-containing protein, partial [Chloroflexi bacterium]|nr:DUF262 domain-containing protein [Chloroflexota bacterium]
MKADVRTTHELFHAPGRYEIPIYQRPYSWEDQWALLWDDVAEVADSHMEDRLAPEAGHFLGAIVLQQRQTAPGELPRWIVIDGQQRLLTMQVLLDASEYAIRNHPAETDDPADELHDLIENKRRSRDKADPDTRFKLWPTSGDREAFREAMTDPDGMIAADDDARILRAHYY